MAKTAPALEQAEPSASLRQGSQLESVGSAMGRLGPWIGVLWLGFIGFPLAELLGADESAGQLILALAALAAFVAIYSVQIQAWRPAVMPGPRSTGSRTVYLRLGALVAIAILLSVLQRDSWAMLFIYCAAAGPSALGERELPFTRPLSERMALGWVLMCGALAGTISGTGGAGFAPAFIYAVSCLGIGLLTISIAGLRLRNSELLAGREQRAQLAVAQERLRFARELHDLLGSSLAVVALKAELTRKLIDRGRLDEAEAHARDIEEVARVALGEVREAVAGFRGAKLPRELERARIGMQAAGIELSVEQSCTPPEGPIEDLLACALREGATNVLKHAEAQRCQITVGSDGERAFTEVRDDGPSAAMAASATSAPAAAASGPAPAAGGQTGGHGLQGLRERALALGGELHAGACGDGFRLYVSAPMRAFAP